MGYLTNNGLTIRTIVARAISRSNRWHKGDLNNWSPLEWAGAMCGEAGEAANAAKKLKRLTDEILSINKAERDLKSLAEARAVVAKEVADVLLYAVVLWASVGITPREAEEIICAVFNRKSEEYGFPEKLEIEE
jgi:NTP pyrophosphatase (non-canonical NTP hydrolase)